MEMDDDVALWVGWLVAGLGPLAVAAVLAPLAEHPGRVGIVVGALVFVIANATALAGPGAGVVTTVLAALTFDFTFVASSSRLELRASLTSWPVILLVAAGLSIVAAARRAQRRARHSEMSRVPVPNQSSRIERITHLVEQDSDPRDLISAVRAELTGLLFARHCEFDDARVERHPASHRSRRPNDRRQHHAAPSAANPGATGRTSRPTSRSLPDHHHGRHVHSRRAPHRCRDPGRPPRRRVDDMAQPSISLTAASDAAWHPRSRRRVKTPSRRVLLAPPPLFAL